MTGPATNMSANAAPHASAGCLIVEPIVTPVKARETCYIVKFERAAAAAARVAQP
jgi:actin-related protein